jgi:hypothetical protein
MDRRYALFMRAVSAAIKIAPGLNPMADDFAPAMLTFGRQRMDGALKTIEVMGDARHHDLQRLVIFVATHFTSHSRPFSYSFSRLAAARVACTI